MRKGPSPLNIMNYIRIPAQSSLFGLPAAGGGGVGLVAHKKSSRNCIVVHDGLGAQLLALSVTNDTEIFSSPEDVLCAVTDRADWPRHLIWNTEY